MLDTIVDRQLGRYQGTSRPGAGAMFTVRAGVLAFAALCYAWVLTRGSFDLFGAEPLGLVFNSMLGHMLEGRWDVDPAVIAQEAFVRDGRSYAYFGPFPALLRLPLVLLPEWRELHVERLSCWLAVMVGITAQSSAVMTALAKAATPARRLLAAPLLVMCASSGAPMLLSWKGALIYHEAILWAWALAMAFAALALPAVQRPGAAGGGRLCALGVCAGLCLSTRCTTGAGLYLAAGLLLLHQLRITGPRASFWAPACVLGGFIVLAGVVNLGRWGDPLVFGDVHLQLKLIAEYPDRLARLERYGLFDWHRLDTGLMYYVFPVWMDRFEHSLPLTPRLLDLYDAIEQPASSLLMTDPAWCVLSVRGVVAIVRRRVFAGEMMLAAGSSLAPVLMVAAWYLAFRYRAEFEPLLLVLSCIGLRAFTPGVRPRAIGWATAAVWLLCLLQVGGAATAGWSYSGQPFGTRPSHAMLGPRCAVFGGRSC